MNSEYTHIYAIDFVIFYQIDFSSAQFWALKVLIFQRLILRMLEGRQNFANDLNLKFVRIVHKRKAVRRAQLVRFLPCGDFR